MSTYVYLVQKPGNDIDGEDACFAAHSLEAAQLKADAHARICRATLKLVGQKTNGRFTPCVAYEELPHWAQTWIDEQVEHDARVAKARRSSVSSQRRAS